jgi:glycosyltransferase involved in cell wall biosynthesis
MSLFHPPPPGEVREDRLIIGVGRLSPIKHYELLIDSVALLIGQPGFEGIRVEIAGGSTEEHGDAYARSLRERVEARGLTGRIAFLGPVLYRDVPTLNRRAAVTVNLCPTGGVDKAVIESTACGTPAVVRNETFLPLFGDDAPLLWAADDSPATLADHLAAVLSLPPVERAALGGRLHQRAQREYDLDSLIDRLVDVFEEVIDQRKRR